MVNDLVVEGTVVKGIVDPILWAHQPLILSLVVACFVAVVFVTVEGHVTKLGTKCVEWVTSISAGLGILNLCLSVGSGLPIVSEAPRVLMPAVPWILAKLGLASLFPFMVTLPTALLGLLCSLRCIAKGSGL